MKREYLYLLIITFIGGVLRFYNLGEKPLWVDEALFGFLVTDTQRLTQEFPTVLLARLFGLHSEFGLRSLSALAGTLSIPAAYFVLKNKRYAIYLSIIIALCPLFVLWSRLARPYSFAGLFIILGWRYAWCYVVAIATTPISFIGVRILGQQKTILISALIFAIILFFFREDSNRNWTVQNAINSSRFFVLPSIACLLYCFDYLFPFVHRRFIRKR